MEYIQVTKLVYPVKRGQSWFGVTHNTNIYRGCNHGCIYCDSRSSCYQIHDFDNVRAKDLAFEKIDQELKSKRKTGVLGFGGMNDPYNIFEKELRYTKEALHKVDKYGFGANIITKNVLVLRDIGLFQRIQTHSIMNVGITITTGNDELQKVLEPYASTTSERFNAIKTLRLKGIYAGILMMPLLPYINDTVENIESIILQAKEADAKYIYPSYGVTLRDNQRQYFLQKIGSDMALKYIKTYGDSYYCESPNVDKLKFRFEELCKQYGILYQMKDIVTASSQHITSQQQTLF